MISRTLWSKYANLNPWTMKEGDKLQSEKESLDKERRQISGLKKEAQEPFRTCCRNSLFVWFSAPAWCGF